MYTLLVLHKLIVYTAIPELLLGRTILGRFVFYHESYWSVCVMFSKAEKDEQAWNFYWLKGGYRIFNEKGKHTGVTEMLVLKSYRKWLKCSVSFISILFLICLLHIVYTMIVFSVDFICSVSVLFSWQICTSVIHLFSFTLFLNWKWMN